MLNAVFGLFWPFRDTGTVDALARYATVGRKFDNFTAAVDFCAFHPMQKRPNRQNEILIDLDDVRLIMNESYPDLDVFLNNVFCPHCSGNTTICDYRIYLDDSNDIIFDGSCNRCYTSVSRYIETGGGRSSAEAAQHIRAIKQWRL